jgi:DNA-packaging protein gp3
MPAPKGHPPYNKKGEGGAPKKWTPERIEAEAAAFEEWMQRPDSIWYESFCLERGFLPDELSRWAKENERFRQVYEKAKAWQKNKLVNGGLLNKFNAGFTKFVMSNTCGWYEKQQITGDSASPLSFLLARTDGSSKDLIDKSNEQS